jgi:hypothetical protein
MQNSKGCNKYDVGAKLSSKVVSKLLLDIDPI